MEIAAKETKHAERAGRDRWRVAEAPSAGPSLHPVLQLQQQAGNQAVQELLRRNLIQAKLTISNPGDPEEQEADRVADHVMRAHAGSPASAPCSCSEGEESCEECRQKSAAIQRRANGEGARTGELGAGAAPFSAILSQGGGQPLDAATRAFFEPRFGHDFSGVRVHTGAAAAESAQSINALAYTLGGHVVFAPGRYNPHSVDGRTLLAHELTHTIQQKPDGTHNRRERLPRLSAAQGQVQRTCGSDLHDPDPDCAPSGASVIGQQFLFVVNCNDLITGEAANLARYAAGLRHGAQLKVHGFASEEGDPAFNLSLSCHRANVIAGMLRDARPDCTISTIFKHGAHGGPPLRDFWRSVIVEEVRPQPEPPNPEASICGPDATDWLLAQVARAKTDPTILEIKANLAGAHRVAAANGFSAEQVAEGGVAKRVLAEETRAGSPTRTADASSQLRASGPSQAAFGRAVMAATVPVAGAPEELVLLAIRRASLLWKGVVGTRMRYDFKYTSMRDPHSAHCPVNCHQGVTFCPPDARNCFGTDLPGNIFYAHLGRFVGFTRLALQLGSQFAQLESTRSWDPPEDTAMIDAGFGLPDPLDRSSLCAAISSLRGVVNLKACTACAEPFEG